MKSIRFTLLTGCLVASMGLASTLQAANRPNIVFVLADDMGYDVVHALNPKSRIATPHIDRLIRQGICFTDAHSGSAVCSPTRYGILTGRYSWRSKLKQGIVGQWQPPLIEPQRLTVGGMLQELGYHTACIGKWHLGWNWPDAEGNPTRVANQVDFTRPITGGPVEKGFDYYFGDDVPNWPPYVFIENDRTQGIPSTVKPKTMFGSPGPMLPGWKLDAVMPEITSRAVDYMRSASAEDRRYLLFNPMVKMKVTTQGEEVINLLWDVIAARGFEKDVYFENAAKDIRALPKLEGTVHVNMALIIKFMANYFFNPDEFPEIPKRNDPKNDAFLFNQGATKGLGKIRFHDFNTAYNSADLPNINVFKQQIEILKEFLMTATPSKEQANNIDFLLSLGELFTLVAYGQLIIEKSNMDNIENDLLDQIFDFMVRDFSKYALQIYF